ncbi:MAG: esterase-like activity of phytase family protein, partial [Verrucomicrobia bacterium]|nr:esterase-like activity of phytase family protein [Verrucomicrobiota bacterium]
GQFLIATGYDAALVTANLSTSTGATIPRVIARVAVNGTANTATALADAAITNNPRSAASVDGSAYWFGGAAGGLRYAFHTATSSTDLTSSSLANIRQPAIFGGQLYVSSASGTNTFKGVSTIGSGLPTSGTLAVTRLSNLSDTAVDSPNMFFMADLSSSVAGIDTLYMVDENGTTGGLTKFSLVAGNWVANGKVGVGADNYRGLTGSVLGTTVTMYATRDANQLVSLVDAAGHNAAITATPTVLATAAMNTAFRGVALAPQAVRPDFLVASVTAPANAVTSTTFSYTMRVGNSGTANATGVAARFTLPSGLNFVSASGTNGFAGTHAAGVVSFTGGSLNAGAVATLTINVTTGTAATYTFSAGAAVVDPNAAIAEASEANNASADRPITIVTRPNTPPTFSTHPANVSISNGATATLTALAAGSPAPTYQWYQGASGNTTNPISGATSASFTTPILVLNQTYWVRATNSQGTADSTTATVTVAPSNNANLSALAVSTLLSEPTFSPADLNYITIVANNVTSMTVTPTVEQSLATITVNGTPLASGGTSGSVALQEGANPITVAVTAQDGSTVKIYTVNVFRSAPPLAAGSIAFIGYNADGDDDLAFVALTDIPDNSVIHFSDNEWNGSSLGGSGAFVDFLESELAWIPPSGGIQAGNVVVMNSLAVKASATTSLGTLVFSDGNPAISATADTIYAFMGGTRVVGSFLAAISSDPALVLTGTGLATGSTAVKLADSSDGAIYNGARSGQVTYASYLPLIGNVATNWTDVLDGTGNTLLPFSTASFSLIGSPIYTHTNRDVLNPNRDVWSGAGVTMNGLQFRNLGIQGVGRIPASQLDSTTGESVGSISDMAITGWTKNVNGTYSGSFNLLPDGGYRSGSTNPNYAARINTFSFTFTPYTASIATAAQNQIAMSFTGSSRFTYDHDGNANTAPIFTTAMTSTSVGSLFGAEIPVVSTSTTQSDGSISNRVTLSTEGLVLDSRSGQSGKGWISDEYNPAILHFDSSKRIIGRLGVPEALVPHLPVGTTDFGTATPTNGRRENQGFEGLAQSPDGTRLFAMMQSATLQDSASGNQGRFNTRVLVYDLSSSSTPREPIAQYVMQLPRIDDTASTTNGTSVSRTGAQSSIVALSNTALLVLARDGNGRGTPGPPPVFKSILLADLSSATDLGVAYNAENAVPAPNGVLQVGITALSWTQALNMIGGLGSFSTEVSKFGLNINGGDGTTNTLSDKWEALSLVSCGDAANPNDFFLFIGNDNNFQTTNGKVMTATGSLATYNAGMVHDSMMLVYRVRVVAPGIKVTYQLTAQILTNNASSALQLGAGVTAQNNDRSFTVENTGTGRIDSLSVTIDGTNAADFSVFTAPTGPLAAAGSTSFTIRLLSSSGGVRNATLHLNLNASGSLSSFDIPVTATLDSALNAWRQNYFGTTDDSGQTALTADFEGDGLSNLLEYALETLPNATTAGNGISVMPRGSIDQSASVLSGRLVLTFGTANTTRADVTYIIQCSNTPDDWTDIGRKVGTAPWAWLAGGTNRIITTINGGRTTVQVGDILPLSEPRRLMRLKVTIP